MRVWKGKYFADKGDSQGKVKCSVTQEKIIFDEAHIDHREPFTFSAIVHFFIKSNNIVLDSIEYITKAKYGNEFKDNELAEKFRVWHHDNAKLRIVKGKINILIRCLF